MIKFFFLSFIYHIHTHIYVYIYSYKYFFCILLIFLLLLRYDPRSAINYGLMELGNAKRHSNINKCQIVHASP